MKCLVTEFNPRAVHMDCEVYKVVLSMVSKDKPPSRSFLSLITALRTAKI